MNTEEPFKTAMLNFFFFLKAEMHKFYKKTKSLWLLILRWESILWWWLDVGKAEDDLEICCLNVASIF